MKPASQILAILFALAAFATPVFADGEKSESSSGGSGSTKTEGLLGDVLVGPKLSVGVPLPIRFGLEGKWMGMLGLSFDYGMFPSLSFDSVSIKANGWNVAARYYPWQQSFYVGLGIGGQTLTGSKTETVVTTVITATASYTQTLLIPQFGWRWVWGSGFFMGMELGVQIPVSKSFTLTTDHPEISNTQTDILKNEVNTQANKYGSIPLPWIGLLQVGYFF